MTKTGEEDIESSVISYYGKCLYCGGKLQAQPSTLNDYDHWTSRADGRFTGTGAP